MDNWEKIIEKCSKKQDNQTMKLITATVTSVTNNFYRANVRLITGQEISNLINQTPNKLYVGQNVEVGYRTTPEAGWIQIAHGEPDPMRQGGGGVEVQTAVLYDAANLHEYTVDTELMVDISANTKLYYGASNRMFVMQGMLCFLGPSNLPSGSTFTDLLDDLLSANSDYIAPAYSGITSYYTSSGVVYRAVADISVFPYQVNVGSDGRVRWWFKLVSTITTTNMSTSASSTNTYTSTVNFYTSNITDITEYGLLLYCSQVGAGSPATAFDSYIPYGYAGASDAPSSSTNLKAVLVYKNNNPNVDKWNADYNGVISPSGGTQTYTYVRVGSYAPLSAAETTYMLGATQRSEPVTPNNGGGA
jgi:hypothetical protein